MENAVYKILYGKCIYCMENAYIVWNIVWNIVWKYGMENEKVSLKAILEWIEYTTILRL